VELFIGVVVVAGLFIIGNYSRFNLGIAVANVPGADSCESACASLAVAHEQVCRFIAGVEQAKSVRDSDGQLLRNAQLVAVGLLAGSVAANLIPIVGPLLAQPLYAAYVAAQAFVIVMLGRFTASSGGVAGAEEALAGAKTQEDEGIEQVRRQCPRDEANRCIAGLRPC
jgi:hypothetical protein